MARTIFYFVLGETHGRDPFSYVILSEARGKDVFYVDRFFLGLDFVYECEIVGSSGGKWVRPFGLSERLRNVLMILVILNLEIFDRQD